MNNLNNYHLMFNNYPDVVNIKQLREMLGVGITKAYTLVNDNIIPSKKIGREYKIPKVMIINYLTNTK